MCILSSNMLTITGTQLGSVYVYSNTGGQSWSLIQTLNREYPSITFGISLSWSPSGTQFAVGAYGTNSFTGMYEMYV